MARTILPPQRRSEMIPLYIGHVILFCEGPTEKHYFDYFAEILNNKKYNDMRVVTESAKGNAQQVLNFARDYMKVEENQLKYGDDFFSCSTISHDTKVPILASILPEIEQEEVIRYLNDLGLSEFIQIFDPHSRPKFPITICNEELLEAFKEKGWICEYVEDPDRNGFYKIRRRNRNKGLSAKQ